MLKFSELEPRKVSDEDNQEGNRICYKKWRKCGHCRVMGASGAILCMKDEY